MVAQCTDAPRMNCKLVVFPQVVRFEWSESRDRIYEASNRRIRRVDVAA